MLFITKNLHLAGKRAAEGKTVTLLLKYNKW